MMRQNGNCCRCCGYSKRLQLAKRVQLSTLVFSEDDLEWLPLKSCQTTIQTTSKRVGLIYFILYVLVWCQISIYIYSEHACQLYCNSDMGGIGLCLCWWHTNTVTTKIVILIITLFLMGFYLYVYLT